MKRLRAALRALLPELRDWLGETVEDELYRRLAACETSVQELWRAHNERGRTPEADRLASLSDAELIEEAARRA